MSSVQFAVLWGHEHPELGVVATEKVSPRIGLALSGGKFPKGYPHLDPNEDAVTAATDGVASLLAVADGHSGHDAARAAIETVLLATPSLLFGATDRPREALQAVFQDAREAIRAALDNKDGERADSRTTLSIALLGPDRVTVAGLGDSSVVLIRDYAARIVGSPAPFLGPDTPLTEIVLDDASLSPGDRVLAATDGLFDFLGRRGFELLARLASNTEPGDLARQAVKAAFSGGAGDNVAIAVAAPTEQQNRHVQDE